MSRTAVCSLALSWVLLNSVAAAANSLAQDDNVAVVNGQGITAAALEARLSQNTALGRSDTPELRARLIEDLIAEELLYQEALRKKFEQSPDFVKALKNAERQALASLVLRSVPVAPVSEQTVRAAYERSVAGLLPNDFRLRAIVLNDETRINQIRLALARGEDFEQLARQSMLRTRGVAGDLGWINLRQEGQPVQGLPARVATEVRKLGKGGFSPIVADEQGRWWLVRLEELRPAKPPAFEQVSAQLRRVLEGAARSQAARQLIADLRKAAVVTNRALPSE